MNLLRRLVNQLSVYLPLIMMALLACGSWWLVRSVPELLTPSANKTVRQEPDYRLIDFSVKSFDKSGRMRREISGDQAQHYPATETLNIDEIRIYAQSETGSTLNAKAAHGVTTDDGSRITLTGDAQAIRHALGTTARVELRGERLLALPDEDRLISTDPVRITRDQDVFTAQTLDFNSNTGEYQLQGRVRGTLMPKAKP